MIYLIKGVLLHKKTDYKYILQSALAD